MEELLHRDYASHHCFFNDLGYHNHLSHHLVAAYDMGAPPALLRMIYDEEAGIQRPVDLQCDDLTERDWTTRLGEATAYGSYLAFFTKQIEKDGVSMTVGRFTMAPEANGNGGMMLARLLAAGFHGLIQVGLGVEFGQDYMVAQGLAMAATTSHHFLEPIMDMPSGVPQPGSPTKGVTLLALLREVYDSPVLKPLPYDADETIRSTQFFADPARPAALKRIYAKWSVDPSLGAAELDARVEECLWHATLLLCATGRPHRAPRLDFFLMHVLTSALCLPSVLSVLPDPVHKAQLLHAYARASALSFVRRGGPRIDVPLLMSYTEHPRPPVPLPGGRNALGDPSTEGETDPWLAIVQNALHHKDAHVVKAVRTLYYCAQRYGRTPAGGAIGAHDGSGKEIHVGMGLMDGTIFVRAAGMLSGTLGWVAYGEKGREWDRSGLGWDAAWENGDDKGIEG